MDQLIFCAILTPFFQIETIAFEIMGYPISCIELLATLFGLVSVWYATKANIWTWPTGIVNEFFLFLLFFQIQLYADMFLQVYFFVVTLYGWYNWNKKKGLETVSKVSTKGRMLLLLLLVLGTWIAGYLFSNIHLYFPRYFSVPASFPYVDSFIMVASIIATILLAKKKVESWYLWLALDVVCVVLYYHKEVYFLSLEYAIFLVLAAYGLYNWQKQLHDA